LLTALKTGKGYILAFFLVFLFISFGNPCDAQQLSAMGYPVINRLNPTDDGFRQFISDVQANRRRLAAIRPRPQEAAAHLTIYQYTVRQGEDIFFLAARCNIPYSTITSLNRLNNPAALQAGTQLLLPSCPGIFIPQNIESDLEMILTSARQENQDIVELRIRKSSGHLIFNFIPGADFTPTERAFFLNSSFRFPLRHFRITSQFGARIDPFTGQHAMHRGIDLAAPEGTEVFAVADGTVTAIGEDPVYGIYIIISHGNNWTSLYAHLQKVETILRTEVKSGTLIGRVGSTGLSTGPHLHFELRQDGRPFDPAGRLRP
jgi:murein DD-endopeptidase MepM/ murein hydrolase activator NlpD